MVRQGAPVIHLIFGGEPGKDKVQTHPQVRICLFRSNSFYKEMAKFIGSKTGIQCRSHHQKYETKHKYPHRIIKEEKEKIDARLYVMVREEMVQNPIRLQEEEELSQEFKKESSSKVTKGVEFACQTDLEGVQNSLTMEVRPLSTKSTPVLPGYQNPPLNYYDQWRMLAPMMMGWQRPFF
jgi:hypothetical protein